MKKQPSRVSKMNLLALGFGLCAGLAFGSAALAQSEPERTPFTDMAFDAEKVVVEVGGQTLNLLGINDVHRRDIRAACEAQFGEACYCNLSEKFTATMAAIGQPVGDTVKLRLYDVNKHGPLGVSEIEAAPVTVENQDELLYKREVANKVCFP